MRPDPAQRALADLRECLAGILDAKTGPLDLLAGHVAAARLVDVAGNPVAEAMEIALPFFRHDLPQTRLQEPVETPAPWAAFLASGLDRLLPGGLAKATVLDPCAGGGAVLAGLGGARAVFAHEARLLSYYRAWKRLKASPTPVEEGRVGVKTDARSVAKDGAGPHPALPQGGNEHPAMGEALSLANPLLLPPREPTPGFDFLFDANAELVQQAREAEVDALIADLRNAVVKGGRAAAKAAYGESKGTLLPMVRWMSDRLRNADGRMRNGVVAFVTDEPFVDEPALAGFRAALAREFDLIACLRTEETTVAFLVRGGDRRGVLYAESEPPADFDEVPWRNLSPNEAHVWRPEILREEWTGFMPLAGTGALFQGFHEGVGGTRDTLAPEDRRARPVTKRPFVRAYRRPERGVAWPEGPFLVVAREPFGAFVADAPPDRRCAGPVAAFARGVVSPAALKRFRAAYGVGVDAGDVFDYAVALLHHPEYRERYHEDLARSLPRIPLLEGLKSLLDVESAPPVGPGTAFGTGWTPPDLFEEGTIPDYDDPFASPYARADVEPGFLLFAALGAALVRVQTLYPRIARDPLARIATAAGTFTRMRLSRDRARVLVHPGLTLDGVPSEVYEHRIGAKSALEWVIEGCRVKGTFAPDAEMAARLAGRVVAASLETVRLAETLGSVDLSTTL